jgi:F-type H+-transporting ATPase subunit delta
MAADSFTKPYLDALFEVAGSADNVEALLPALASVAAALEASEPLRTFLRNPAVDRPRKSAALSALAKKAGATPLASRLLEALLGNRRITGLGALVKDAQARLDRERNVAEAVLTTAVPLDAKAHGIFRQVLEKRTKATVRLVPKVDAKLLGGFVIRVGSEVYDCSLAARLDRVKAALHARGGAAT